MEYLIIWILCGIASFFIAGSRGANGCGWAIGGFLLGPIGLIMSFAAGKSSDERAIEQAALNAKAITEAQVALVKLESLGNELEKLAKLLEQGHLTDDEFQQAKEKLLSQIPPQQPMPPPDEPSSLSGLINYPYPY